MEILRYSIGVSKTYLCSTYPYYDNRLKGGAEIKRKSPPRAELCVRHIGECPPGYSLANTVAYLTKFASG